MKCKYVHEPKVEYRPFQKKLIEKLLREDAKWVFVDAPTGSGKTLIALSLGICWSRELGLPFVSFVRTRSQLSSFVRDYWKFWGALPRVFLAKSVVCRRFRGGGELEDFERLPSCSYCKLQGKTQKLDGKVFEVVEKYLRRGVYDPYVVRYPVDSCPYIWWELIDSVDLVHAPVVATYVWLFNDWLYPVFRRRLGGVGSVVGVVDEAHNLDDFVVDRLAGVSYRVWDAIGKRCGHAIDYARAKPVFRTVARVMATVDRICSGVPSRGIIADRHVEKVMQLRRTFVPLLPVRFQLRELSDDLISRGEYYVRTKGKDGIALGGEYYVLGRYIERLHEFLENFEEWLKGENEYLRCLLRPRSVSIISVHTGNIYLKISKRMMRGLFISGTLPPKDYIVNVWGFPEEEILYERVVLRGFGKVRWKVVKGVTSRYTRRGNKMYRLYAEVVAKECSGVDGVCLVAFPSYDFMREVRRYLRVPGSITLEESRKTRLGEIYEAVKRYGRVVLLVTMGGKFVEGVELVDGSRSLIRKVVVVGVPYEHPSELADEIVTANKLDRWLFINVRAYFKVRQALGRAIRFENDEAMFVLCDDRYLSDFWRRSLLPS